MDFVRWLRQIGLGDYAESFRRHDVDFDVAEELDDTDLRELGLTVGDRKRLRKALAERLATVPARAEFDDAPDPWGAERRHLTVMFIDLAGSTALSARLDPEQMADVIRTYRAVVAEQLVAVDGYLAKYMGDGIVAYFGYPQAQEDSGERAVRAGLAVARAVGQLTTPDGTPLAVRIGVAAGLVVVGELVGRAEGRERDVVGETPNLAARLQSVAEPGQVVIDGVVRDLIGDHFELMQIDVGELKGFDFTPMVYAVLGERFLEHRFAARHVGRLAPLAGRKGELQALRDLWNRACAGRPQVALLVGEAGIGKSRLAAALSDAIAGEPHQRLVLQCSPYHRDTALHPIVQQWRHVLGADTGSDTNPQLDALETHLSGTVANARAAAALIARLLAIDARTRYGDQELAAQELRERTLLVLLEHFRGLAAKRPLLLVFEDVHWIDPTSLALLQRTVQALRHDTVLMVLTARPDAAPALPAGADVTTIPVVHLNDQEAARIVRSFADDVALPEELLNGIVAQTDGVPLFVEEATKMLLASGTVEQAESDRRVRQPEPPIAIPSSLQDTLMARLGRSSSRKFIAQAAACVGRVFDYDVVRAAAAVSPVELDQALAELEAADLIHAHTGAGGRYAFKHALVRDAAYESLLRSNRRRVHERIITELKRSGAAAEVLAHHHAQAGQPLEAAACLLAAGRKALEISAAQEAITYLQRGVATVEAVPSSPEVDRLRSRLFAMLGTGHMLATSWAAPEAEDAYTRALAYSDAAEDVRERVWIQWGGWVFRQVRGHIDVSARQALAIARTAAATSDREAQLVAEMVQLQTAFYQGRLVDSLNHAARFDELYTPSLHDELRDSYSTDLLLVRLVHAAHCHCLAGDAAATAVGLAQARDRASQVAHAYSKTWAAVWGANVHLLADNTAEVLATVPEAVADAQERGFHYVSTLGRLILAAARLRARATPDGLSELDAAMADFRMTGAGIVVPYFEALRAEALGELGEVQTAHASISAVLDTVEREGERWFQPLALRIEGDLLARLGLADRAATAYRRAAAVAQEQGAFRWQAEAERALAGVNAAPMFRQIVAVVRDPNL